jgi:hypothetical protein
MLLIIMERLLGEVERGLPPRAPIDDLDCDAAALARVGGTVPPAQDTVYILPLTVLPQSSCPGLGTCSTPMLYHAVNTC